MRNNAQSRPSQECRNKRDSAHWVLTPGAYRVVTQRTGVIALLAERLCKVEVVVGDREKGVLQLPPSVGSVASSHLDVGHGRAAEGGEHRALVHVHPDQHQLGVPVTPSEEFWRL